MGGFVFAYLIHAMDLATLAYRDQLPKIIKKTSIQKQYMINCNMEFHKLTLLLHIRTCISAHKSHPLNNRHCLVLVLHSLGFAFFCYSFFSGYYYIATTSF